MIMVGFVEKRAAVCLLRFAPWKILVNGISKKIKRDSFRCHANQDKTTVFIY